jgi:hypothetical protein
MPVNIDDQDIENILDEIVRLTGESRIEAIRNALDERHRRLLAQTVTPRSEARLLAFLEDEIWSPIPSELLGQPLTIEEEETILGYGEAGV